MYAYIYTHLQAVPRAAWYGPCREGTVSAQTPIVDTMVKAITVKCKACTALFSVVFFVLPPISKLGLKFAVYSRRQ